MSGHDVQQIIPLLSNVPKTDYPVYDNTKVYEKGEMCTILTNGKNYYNTVIGTTGVNPASDFEIWDSEPMNYLKMFDYTNSGKTINDESIEVTFKASNIDAISFFGLVATDIEVILVDNDTGTEEYRKTEDLVEDELEDFADYLYSEQELLSRVTISLPVYFDTTITIKINNPGSKAECAFCTVGMQKDLGFTLKDGLVMNKTTINIDERDKFGNINFKNALTFNTITADIYTDIPFSTLDRKLSKIQGKPYVFIPTFKIAGTNILGIYQDLQLPIDPFEITYKLEIKSLIKDYND